VTATVVKVTDETTATELAETLALLCEDAKRVSRRGKVGTLSADYAMKHRRINAVLAEYLSRA
jgi:hypothetical protein